MHWYLQTNPMVARLKINPVVHYMLEGEMAGRRPVPYFDPLWYRETYAIAGGPECPGALPDAPAKPGLQPDADVRCRVVCRAARRRR